MEWIRDLIGFICYAWHVGRYESDPSEATWICLITEAKRKKRWRP